MSLSLKGAARKVLQDAAEPLHYQEITKRILDGGLSQSKSKTPAASLNAVLAVDIKRNGSSSPFVRVTPGVFGLRGEGEAASSVAETPDDADRRVRIPHFPPYDEVRLVLPVWDGMKRGDVTGLQSAFAKLIDLLIAHGIGVRKKAIEVLDLDPEAFAEVEESLAEQGGEGWAR